ncbi:YdcH family protein [Brevirhabdus sp.]|uniref:YdcH family protein n=1 Tax=Brevirhabdus sp. TaxID=2004514 RepID=UPI0040596D44
MALSSHVQELRKKHQNLEQMVASEQRSPSSDALHIASMKKQKLRLKEEIERLSR